MNHEVRTVDEPRPDLPEPLSASGGGDPNDGPKAPGSRFAPPANTTESNADPSSDPNHDPKAPGSRFAPPADTGK